MICPICEKGKLKQIKKHLIFSYKRKSKTFGNEHVLKCDVCHYESLPRAANKRIVKELTDFRKEVLNR